MQQLYLAVGVNGRKVVKRRFKIHSSQLHDPLFHDHDHENTQFPTSVATAHLAVDLAAAGLISRSPGVQSSSPSESESFMPVV